MRALIIGLMVIGIWQDGFCQDSHFVTGKVTYIAPDVVYTSLGRNDGIADSSLLYVVVNSDTVAILKVFAVSSRSTACTIVSSIRPLKIGDPVMGLLVNKKVSELLSSPTVGKDSLQIIAVKQQTAAKQPERGVLQLQGRITAQYRTTFYRDSQFDVTQPGLIINTRGQVHNSPMQFEIYANMRSSIYRTQNPFASRGINNSRISRLSLSYDDSSSRITLGRFLPSSGSSGGYIDGLSIARSFGVMTFGIAGGFEPDFRQRAFISDRRKLVAFGHYISDRGIPWSIHTSYARTYAQALLDREVAGLSISIAPSRTIFFSAQSEVDLHTFTRGAWRLKPKLSSLFISSNFRLIQAVSFGIGYNAWRSIYPYSIARVLPDSFIDRKLRTSPGVTLNILLPGGVSVFENYSPRSSGNGFGKEYFNSTSVGVGNVFGQALFLRVGYSLNKGAITTTRGFNSSIQQSFGGVVDITLQYRHTRYSIDRMEPRYRSESLSGDILIALSRRLSWWMSVERSTGFSSDGYLCSTEMSWRL